MFGLAPGLVAASSELDVGVNKQAYDTHVCFLLIIPEVTLHGDEDKIKLNR